MTRIYKVNTPNGVRLVEASTKGQAINHCVTSDYSAEPINSSELYASIEQGAKVEKVAPGKKLDSQTPSHSPVPPASSPSLTAESLPTSAPLSPPTEAWQAPLPQAAMQLINPPTAPAVNPILAEQQRINPEAAKAAGAPIIPIAPRPTPPPAPQPADWQERGAS